MAAILPDNEGYLFSKQKSLPAIKIGIAKAFEEQYLDPDRVSFNLTHGLSKCGGVQAPLSSFNLYHFWKADVFFGPCCDYSLAPVARYSPYWNIPVITSGGLARDFALKWNDDGSPAEFSTLTRVGANLEDLHRVILTAPWANDWQKVKLVFDEKGLDHISQGFCFLAMSALAELKNHDISYDSFKLKLSKQDGKISNVSDVLRTEIGREYGGEVFYPVVETSVRLVQRYCCCSE